MKLLTFTSGIAVGAVLVGLGGFLWTRNLGGFIFTAVVAVVVLTPAICICFGGEDV